MENDIEILKKRFEVFPAVTVTMDEPADKENGLWHLDLVQGEKRVTVGWKREKGFGLSETSAFKQVVYGEGWEHVTTSLEGAFMKAQMMLLN
ncbi:MAG TPA: hypothetical protein VJH55_03105 [Candidatus Paceibacterota bacterium]